MSLDDTVLKEDDFKETVKREIKEISTEDEKFLVTQCNEYWEEISKKYGPLRTATIYQISLKAFEHKVKGLGKESTSSPATGGDCGGVVR